jgi:spore coat polysaccharide biosynthesis predicted glycosyltransferase SpsG
MTRLAKHVRRSVSEGGKAAGTARHATGAQAPAKSNVYLFRTAAGPRRGFGHLVRCRSLARALEVTPQVSLRGGADARTTARSIGCTLVDGGPRAAITASGCKVVVVDDPIATDAHRWIHAARREGRAVASVHDLGIGCMDADLVIDGSVVRKASLDLASDDVLSGPEYAVVDPGLLAWRAARLSSPGAIRVLIALGGGPHAALAAAIAEELVAADRDVQVRIVGGFVSGGRDQLKVTPRVSWIGRTSGLAEELARADIAVVGGGVTLYEACAIGTAAVAVPVVEAQRETVAAFVARGAATGIVDGPVQPSAVARMVLDIVRDTQLKSKLERTGSRVVDGLGAMRAARAVAQLASTKH